MHICVDVHTRPQTYTHTVHTTLMKLPAHYFNWFLLYTRTESITSNHSLLENVPPQLCKSPGSSSQSCGNKPESQITHSPFWKMSVFSQSISKHVFATLAIYDAEGLWTKVWPAQPGNSILWFLGKWNEHTLGSPKAHSNFVFRKGWLSPQDLQRSFQPASLR